MIYRMLRAGWFTYAEMQDRISHDDLVEAHAVLDAIEDAEARAR